MPEQDTKTLEGADETTKEAQAEKGEPAEEQTAPQSDFEAEPADDGPTITSGPESTSDGKEPEQEASTSDSVEPDAGPGDDPDVEYVTDESPNGAEVSVATDDGNTGDPSDAQSPSPPEVSIGISAVEPLPEPADSGPAVDTLLEEEPLRAGLEVADDDQVEDEERVDKPVVKDEPDPDGFPDLSENGPGASVGESLDVMDLASGDGDASEPDLPDPAVTREKQPDVDSKEANDTPDVDSGAQDSDLSVASADGDEREDDGDGNDEQQADVPVVEPAISAAVELPAERGEEVEASAPDPVEAGLADDSVAVSSDPAAFGLSLDAIDLADPVDPVAEGAIEETEPQAAGPDLGAATAAVARGSSVDPGGQGDGPVPVSDSSGIQSGEATSTQTGTGSSGAEVQLSKLDDGSTIQTTTYPDGSTVVNETSADNSTSTTTAYDEDGKWAGTSTTTQHEDGSTVTEVEDPDGTVREVHSDGTTIILHPDGTTEVIEPEQQDEDDTDDEEDQQEEQEEEEEEEETETEQTGESETTTDDSASDSADEDSASRPVDDGLVDPERLAAMHQQEAEWQQSIRESSTINPVRIDAGAPEGGGHPPPGVDDPPEDESPRPDELPEDDPADIGLSAGTIDFGPDHIDEPQGGGSDPSLSEELGTQPDQPESPGADPDESLTLDPAAMLESTEDILDSMAGISPDEGLGFWDWGTDFNPEPDEDQGTPDDGDDLM